MKIKFWKKGSKSSGIINEVNFRATPTDEEVQFGFKKTAINSENQPPSSSSAKKQLNFSAVSKTEKSPNHLKKSPEKNKKVDTSLRNVKKSDNHEKSCNVKNFSSVKKNSSKTPRQPSSERFPSLSFSSTSSSNTQSSHELVRYHKNQSRQHYVNGGLSSIDEELSRKTTRPKNDHFHTASNPKLERNNSMIKLNNWVHHQKMKQHHRISDPPKHSASILNENKSGETNRAPRAARRQQIRSHNDFMDGNEPASSILSVPIIRNKPVRSLPRPRSSQDVNQDENYNRKVVNWKSVGYLSPDYEKEAVRITSEQILSRNPNDPTASSGRSRGKTIISPQPRTPSFFEAIKMGSNQTFRFDAEAQIRNQNTTKSPAWNIEVDGNDVEIEEKLNRLRKLETAFRQVCEELGKLENWSNVNKKVSSPRSNDADVKSRVFQMTEKLKLVQNGCETLLFEVNSLKKERLEELNRNDKSKSKRHQLEWSLGRIQISLEKLNKIKEESEEKQEKLNGFKLSIEELNAKKSPSNRPSLTNRVSNDSRSPKRKSQKSVIAPNSRVTSDNNANRHRQFSTLPNRGVYRSISSTSLGGGSTVRFALPLPTTQTNNLQRSKSAAERLLSSSHGNLAAGRDPDEIKKLQREINRNRRRTLVTGASRKLPLQQNFQTRVGMDMKIAMKNYRMPKVLQRSKQQRAEMDRAARRDHASRLTSDPRPDVIVQQTAAAKSDQPDVDNSMMQLIDIENNVVPRARLYKSTSDISSDEKYDFEKKIIAIEKVMPRDGQTVFQPNSARLAAALAAEATSASKVISCQVQPNENSCFA